MRRAEVRVHDVPAGVLEEVDRGRAYRFTYREGYDGAPVSLSLPSSKREYAFDEFPAFFDGLLPEGVQLDGLLRFAKIDARDLFSQLVAVGGDLVGAVTVIELVESTDNESTDNESTDNESTDNESTSDSGATRDTDES